MTPTAAARAQHATATLRDRLKDPSLLKEACYIDGAWVGTPVFAVNNPATGVEIAKVPQLGADDTTKAVEAAQRAFPAWAKHTAKQRSNILRKWFELITANREDLALILTSEQGKPLSEALGEVDIGAAYIEFFAEEARRVYGETIPTPAARCAAARDQAADRRLRRHHAVEFPELDDHAKGVAGACRGLHRGAEARQRDAAVGAGAGRARREGRHPQGRAQHHHR